MQTKRSSLVPSDPEIINEALKEHCREASDWEYQEHATLLHEWADRFNQEFELGVQTPAIALERISSRRYGTYRMGRNGLGLRHEITLNTKYLDRPLSDQLETVLHELVHEWQSHNREFRHKALTYGLVVDHRGCTIAIRPGQFTELLARFGVEFSSLWLSAGQVTDAKTAGQSKMQKYRCRCTTVRCATELAATCDRCQSRFLPSAAAW